MRGIVSLILLINVLSGAQNLRFRLEKEVDLSFYLRPFEAYRVFVGPDFQGNLFISQKGKEDFIKIDCEGRIVLKGPAKIEGEIINMDVDASGNPVCLYPIRRLSKEKGKGDSLVFPLVWYDGKTGKKIKELNLAEEFFTLFQFKILRPFNFILVNGLANKEELKKFSLHIIDFEGDILVSFSEVDKTSGEEIIKAIPCFCGIQ